MSSLFKNIANDVRDGYKEYNLYNKTKKDFRSAEDELLDKIREYRSQNAMLARQIKALKLSPSRHVPMSGTGITSFFKDRIEKIADREGVRIAELNAILQLEMRENSRLKKFLEDNA
jgi:hypothetical protein